MKGERGEMCVSARERRSLIWMGKPSSSVHYVPRTVKLHIHSTCVRVCACVCVSGGCEVITSVNSIHAIHLYSTGDQIKRKRGSCWFAGTYFVHIVTKSMRIRQLVCIVSPCSFCKLPAYRWYSRWFKWCRPDRSGGMRECGGSPQVYTPVDPFQINPGLAATTQVASPIRN